MAYVRAAFYLDFDNVFGGLYKLDPDVAVQFASDPGVWLRRLATTLTGDSPRRWLVLRCYLNPAGWVSYPDATGARDRLFFSKFRPSFVRAGFEVVDCPRYSGTKNAADIRIVVDAVDALSADTRYDEFVIASGDSDMTPLLQRLRRSDRRTMIVSPADAAEAFTSIADQILDSQRLLALVQGESVEFDDDGQSPEDEAYDGRDTPDTDADARSAGPVPPDEAYQLFRSVVVTEYEAATGPVNMASLASRLRSHLGPVIGDSDWFGYGSFARAVQSLDLPNLQMSQLLLWDEARHQAPEPAANGPQRVPVPEPLDRLADTISLPRMPAEWWQAVYRTLSEYAGSHRFNLTQCTSWCRDRLREQGLTVSRGAVAFVARGASFGGCPLYGQPPPTADQICAAFVQNVLSRAESAELTFTSEELATVTGWLGVPADPDPAVDPPA